jgi:hypothetical protein
MNARRTAADVARWVELATQVALAIRTPTRPMHPLERACARAHKAVMPCEPYSAANPWLACLKLATRFAGETAVVRSDLAGELEAALARARAHASLSDPPTRAAGLPSASPGPLRPWYLDED